MGILLDVDDKGRVVVASRSCLPKRWNRQAWLWAQVEALSRS